MDLNKMIKNVFITGLPGCGKTTLIKEILKELKSEAGGFYTLEIRKGKERIGFEIVSLDGKKGVLAHKDFKSKFKVSKYGVNIEDLDRIGTNAILKAIKENKVCVIDEIGGMEIKSEKFKRAAETALNSSIPILGTITLKSNPFCDKIKQRKDTKVFYLTRENREKVKKEILWHFQNLQKKK
jgi:nucleoside-triphosphatase